MKIYKKPANLIFDTECPDQIMFNRAPVIMPTPLHQVIATKSEWEFLSEYFAPKEEVQHPIFNDFGSSFFYCVQL